MDWNGDDVPTRMLRLSPFAICLACCQCPASSCVHPAALAAVMIVSVMPTPPGMGVPTLRIVWSVMMLRRRSSTGSMFSASASLSIWLSAAKWPWGPPKPRNAAPGTWLV